VSIQVFQEPDGRWRWEYREDKVGLKSNRTYGDAGSARRAAQIAYPDSFSHRTPVTTGGLMGKIAKVLTIVLVIVVWRRRTAAAR
jgi:hypothetical protein